VIVEWNIYVKNVDILKDEYVIEKEAVNILTSVMPVIKGATATILK
jgi:hypothetical protein